MKLIMTKGLPASGKSTWAIEQVEKLGCKRVSKDSLRLMLDVNKWSKKNEAFVIKLRNTIVVEALKKGVSIIVDDTNLNTIHEESLRSFADEFGAEFIIQDFTDVPLEECIKRDQKRSNYVGEKVFRQMYNQWLKPKVVPVEHNPELPNVIICDIDGTLALFGNKNPYDRDFENDEVNTSVVEVLNRFQTNEPFKRTKVILFSGRTDKFKLQTEAWLRTNNVPYDELHMRQEGDVRKDSVIKQELYETHIKGKFNVLFVLDDRNQVVDLWRSLGLTCFQVAEGDF